MPNGPVRSSKSTPFGSDPVAAAAATPEELETLLEDAFVLRDECAFDDLFERRAVVVTSEGPRRRAGAPWPAVERYVAERRRIVQAGDCALLIGARTFAVLHRGPDRGWRYAITSMGGGSAGFSLPA